MAKLIHDSTQRFIKKWVLGDITTGVTIHARP